MLSVRKKAATRISRLFLSSSGKSTTQFDAVRPSSASTFKSYHTVDLGNVPKFKQNVFSSSGNYSQRSKESLLGVCASNRLFGPSLSFSGNRLFSSASEAKGSVPVANAAETGTNVSDGGVGGDDLVGKVKEVWQSTVDAAKYTGEKVKEVSDEAAPHVQQLLDTHPYLRDVIVPVGGTLAGTLLAWSLLPRLLRRLHKYSNEGSGALFAGSSVWGPIPYEKSFWGALQDPARYFVTFVAFLQMGEMVAPTVILSQYVVDAWRGGVIVSLVWFLHRWKTNVISRALAAKGIEGAERNKLLALDKFSSVGLFAVGLMALAEACGVAVQSILTVGGIGGVATAFASKDILGNVLSGLSVQISQPFSIGDTIKAGNIEGQVVEMGLTTTSLLTAEKFPVIVPNSLFSSQVIVNKSRAQWRGMVRRIPLRIDDIEKISLISEDIKSMLRSNSHVFLGKEAPYCYLTQIERSYAELTLGCNLKDMNKDAEQNILLQAVRIIKEHGVGLGSTQDETVI